MNVKKLAVTLGMMLLAAVAIGQVPWDATTSATVAIDWNVADRISTSGDVTLVFDTETSAGTFVAVADSHELNYVNNQTVNRKIVVHAIGLPTGLTLTAVAGSPTAGTGSSVLTLTTNPQNLITLIPGGTTNGSAQVTFGAVASTPITDGTTVTIKYTITAN